MQSIQEKLIRDFEFNEEKSCIIEPDSDSKKGGIWIGDFHAAHDIDGLKDAGISHVVTALEPDYCMKLKQLYPAVGITQLHIKSGDHPKCNLYQHFETVCGFIADARKNGNVMVHCFGGVSRSCTLTLAYLMKNKKIGWSEALKSVQEKRPICNPNPGFKAQ
jgi:dual specificity phosphatase 12